MKNVSSLKTDLVGLSETELKAKYQEAADSAKAKALKQGLSVEEADAIAAIALATGDPYKVAVRKMRAKAKASEATVKSVTLTAEEKARKENPAARVAVIKKAEQHDDAIRKFIGDLKGTADQIKAANKQLEDLKETFSDKVRKGGSALRDHLQGVRDYFAHKPADELFRGKYKVGEDYSQGEYGVCYDYFCRVINKLNEVGLQRLLLGEGDSNPNPPSEGNKETADETSARQRKAVIGAVNKVLTHASSVPEGMKSLLKAVFSDEAKPPVAMPIEITDAEAETRTASASGYIPVRNVTALVVDLYGTRVSVHDVDYGLVTPSVVIDILKEVTKALTKHMTYEDEGAVLRGHNLGLEDLLNNRAKTLVTVNPANTESEAISA
jgi:hypothetical protein